MHLKIINLKVFMFMLLSKMLLTINGNRSKIARNNVFDCYLSPVELHMAIKSSLQTIVAIKTSVSNYF